MSDQSQALAAPGANTILAQLQKMQPQLAAALPRHLKPERMVRLAMTALRKNPRLTECDPRSFLGAVMQAAQLGLEPDGLLGEAFLIPYKRECTLQLGYKGLLKLARQSGIISTITARAVHEGDLFTHEYGSEETVTHVPKYATRELTFVYAIAKLRDGGEQLDVMPIADVWAIRDKSPGYQTAKRYGKDSPWDTHPEEMAKKTVLRRLCKLLPASVELARAVALDEHADVGVSQGLEHVLDVEGVTVEPLAGPEGKRMSLRPEPLRDPNSMADLAEEKGQDT